MKLVEYADEEMLAIGLANQLAGSLSSALEHEGRILFVVPGGSTPGPVFDSLCDADIDWNNVDIMLSDERWVPQVHIRSNSKLVRERLLTGRAAAARFLPFYERTDAPEDTIAELEERIKPCLPISVLLLGMGTDMHTASIFPKGDNLETALDRRAPVVVPMRAKGAQDVRVTLSARVLAAAMDKHLVITGRKKRAALERARGLSHEEAPVAAVLEDMTVHWAE